MGAAVGAALTQRGHTVQWLPAGRSDATRARASAAGLTDSYRLRSLVASSELVVFVVPPEAAVAVCVSVAPGGAARGVGGVGVGPGSGGLPADGTGPPPATSRAISGMVSD